MKLFVSTLCLLTLMVLTSRPTHAVKILPQAKGSGKQVTSARPTGSGITVSPRLRGDRKGLLVSFGNLQNAGSVSYQLIYNTSGQQEGAGGSIASSGNAASRELLFGTCSKDVCRYHINITNMRFEVTYTATSGKKYLKRYRIKV